MSRVKEEEALPTKSVAQVSEQQHHGDYTLNVYVIWPRRCEFLNICSIPVYPRETRRYVLSSALHFCSVGYWGRHNQKDVPKGI